jgi:uncharacterized lipoprotein YmbA
MFVKALFTFLTLFALVGCINTQQAPETFYYILDSTPESTAHTTAAKTGENVKQIKVNPVVLPDYLNQPNLVLKLSDHQIKIANYHFWAEDLRQSIQQVLINELNLQNPQITFAKVCSGACLTLDITIDHFYPTEDGNVLLAGTYYRSDKSLQKRFVINKSLREGGYDEAVPTMRALLSELASEIKY